jgi:hypothetical protein
VTLTQTCDLPGSEPVRVVGPLPLGFGTTLNEYLRSKKVKFTNRLTSAS